jgi:uncharacterized protein (TIGR03067 family)
MKGTALLILAASLALGAADAPKEAVKKELEKMQGDWVIVTGQRNGEPIPEEQVKGLRRTTKGDKFILNVGGKTVGTATFKIDPTKKPKTIDIQPDAVEGQEKPAPLLGIYELDGDNYKICYGPPGAKRPTEFASKAGSGATLSVWKRAKK